MDTPWENACCCYIWKDCTGERCTEHPCPNPGDGWFWGAHLADMFFFPRDPLPFYCLDLCPYQGEYCIANGNVIVFNRDEASSLYHHNTYGTHIKQCLPPTFWSAEFVHVAFQKDVLLSWLPKKKTRNKLVSGMTATVVQNPCATLWNSYNLSTAPFSALWR